MEGEAEASGLEHLINPSAGFGAVTLKSSLQRSRTGARAGFERGRCEREENISVVPTA